MGDLLAFLLLAACAANLTVPLWSSGYDVPPFDLHYFVRAGQLWLDGGTPYGADYHADVPGQLTPEGYFVYPPAIRPFCEWIAALPTEARRAAVAFAALSAWAVTATATASQLPTSVPLLWRTAGVGVLLAFVAIGTRLSTDGGQTTPLLAAGLAGVLWSVRREGQRADAALAAGLVLLLLKPQIGVPVLLVFLVRRARLAALLAALVVTAALTTYGAGGRPDLVAAPYLQGLGAYESFEVNTPALSAGPGTILALFGVPAPPTWGCGLVVLAVTAAVSRRAAGTKRAVGAAVVAPLALLPTHAYDHVLLVPLVVLVPALAPAYRLRACAAGLLVLQSLVLSKAALPAANATGLPLPSFLHLAALIDASVLMLVLLFVAAAILRRPDQSSWLNAPTSS